MTTPDLISYIQSQLKKNTSKDLIISHLSENGWRMEDIEEGFLGAVSSQEESIIPAKIEVKYDKSPDPYRELPAVENINSIAPVIAKKEITPKIEEPRVWTPMNIKPVTPEIKKEEVKKEIELSEKINLLAVPNGVGAQFSKPKINEVPTLKFETPVLSAVSFNQPKKSFSDFKSKDSSIVQVPYSISPNLNNPVSEKSIPKAPFKPIFSTTPSTASTTIPQVPIEKKIEVKAPLNTIAQSAIISSFSKDFNSANLVQDEVIGTQNKSIIKTLLILFAIFLIIGGVSFAFINGYIKIPSGLIKKDAKVILLESSSNFNKLKSYKVETDVNLSSPLFANITSGLINGEAVVSNDRDFISVNSKSLVSRNNPSPSNFNRDLTLKSSIINLDNGIKTNIKYDGTTSYVEIPNLSSVLGSSFENKNTVSFLKEQFDLITPELPLEYQDKIKKIGIFNILLNTMSPSFGEKFSPAFKSFIKSATMAEKQSEIINGQDSYHYEINIDRQNTKKFLVSLMKNFANTISSDTKPSIEETLGSTSIDSFEIWISKNDSNILQYKFTLSAPLSKIIGLDDKGIADNKVKLDWKTTYSDFDVPNEIIMPKQFISAEDYIKTIHDLKIKNTLLSFNSISKNLLNAEGTYGKLPNKNGSCISPDFGSLFSPLGHVKGASTAVGSIASTMNDLISLTSEPSVCYSTLKTWAISSPLSGEPKSFFCVDNTGKSETLTEQPKGPSCVIPVTAPVVSTNPKI